MPGKVVSREEWLVARKELLVKEKAALRAKDAFYAQLRNEFPMVKIDKAYTFEGPNGKVQLQDLFEGRKQLIVYHFMLGPNDKVGCDGCSFLTDNLPSHPGHLNYRDTTLVLVSRAPYAQIVEFKKRMGWNFPWFSSYESDFNYDYHVTMDSSVAPPMSNYAIGSPDTKGERPGLSIFLKDGDDLFHTYSTYSRGVEAVMGTYHLLDLTPLGRQEDGPNADWKLHDEY